MCWGTPCGRTGSADGCLLARPVDIIVWIPSRRWATRPAANALSTVSRRVALLNRIGTNTAAGTFGNVFKRIRE